MDIRSLKKMSKKLFCMTLFAGSCWLRLTAQSSPDEAKALLKKMQQAYRQASYLGFQIKYFYANESQPGKHLDSLTGEVEMDKSHCRFAIDGTETIVTDKYTIQVMNGERSIYLSQARQVGPQNPMSLLDSLFAHLDGVQANIKRGDQSVTLTLDFPPGKSYTRIRMDIDAKTGFFQSIGYFLHTSSLVEQEMIDEPGHPGIYESEGQIHIVFSHYEHGHFNDALFNEKNYFDKVAGRFEAAGRYKDYHIFLASSNL